MGVLELIGVIAGAIAAIAGAVKAYFHYRTEEKPEDPVVSELTRNIQMEGALKEEILETLDADRAFIYEFHDGREYFSGNHAMRFTGTVEVTAPGVSAEVSNDESQDVSKYTEMLSAIRDKEAYTVDRVNLMPDGKLKYKLIERGTKSFAVVPIRNHFNKNLIGMLGASWVRDKHDITERELVTLARQAAVISGYLNGDLGDHPKHGWFKDLILKLTRDN